MPKGFPPIYEGQTIFYSFFKQNRVHWGVCASVHMGWGLGREYADICQQRPIFFRI